VGGTVLIPRFWVVAIVGTVDGYADAICITVLVMDEGASEGTSLGTTDWMRVNSNVGISDETSVVGFDVSTVAVVAVVAVRGVGTSDGISDGISLMIFEFGSVGDNVSIPRPWVVATVGAMDGKEDNDNETLLLGIEDETSDGNSLGTSDCIAVVFMVGINVGMAELVKAVVINAVGTLEGISDGTLLKILDCGKVGASVGNSLTRVMVGTLEGDTVVNVMVAVVWDGTSDGISEGSHDSK
jgi:hypothetical protein